MLICPYCNKPVGRSNISRDHILPKRRGGTLHNLNVTNIRLCHHYCNNAKENAGDCIGALACARAVADDPNLLIIGKTRQFIGIPSDPGKKISRRLRKILKVWRLMDGEGCAPASAAEVTKAIPRRSALSKASPSQSKGLK